MDDYVARNKEQTDRLKRLRGLSEEQMSRPLGEHWTVGACLTHIQYWDGRALGGLEAWKRHGVPLTFWRQNESAVNDLRLDLWLAVAPREALEQAIVTAEALDSVVAGLSVDEAAAVAVERYRVLDRSLHRNDHLSEIDDVTRA